MEPGQIIPISPAAAWMLLADEPSAVLVDVRTSAEWFFAGMPDLRSLNKTALTVSWQTFPSLTFNTAFGDQVAEKLTRGVAVVFLSRSGNRSHAAAETMAKRGFARCYT